MKTNGFFVRGLTTLLIVGIFLMSFLGRVPQVLAAGTSGNNPTPATNSSNAQQQSAQSTASQDASGGTSAGSKTTTASSGNSSSVASNTGGCLISGLLAQILTNAIYSVIAAAVAGLGIPGVRVKIENSTDEIKTYGVTIAGTYIPIIPGLDSIAYCLLNSIIEYIADATIEWINSGFEGNPAFVDDPQGFFQGVVDREVTNFMQEMQEGLICQPLQLELQLALLQQATQDYASQSSCGEGGTNSLNALGSGRYSVADSNRVLLNGNTNPVNNYFNATDSLTARVQGKSGLIEMEVNWGNGFLSVPDPDNPNRRITLGTLVEQSAAKRIGFAEDRLILAEKFDQVITTLVNQLVKIAISELFSDTGAQVNVHEVNYEAYKQYLDRQQTQNNRPLLEVGAQGSTSR